MHLIKTVISLFTLSSFAVAQLGEDEFYSVLARREVDVAHDQYLAAREEFLAARDEYIEKRAKLQKKKKCHCYKDGIQNLCGYEGPDGKMIPQGICPRGNTGKSCPC